MKDDILELEKDSKKNPHVFSYEFENRMRRLIGEYAKEGCNKETYSGYEFKSARVKVFGRMIRRSVVVVIAAVLILATTIATIAITKPDIIFLIKEKLTHWDILPVKQNEDYTENDIIPIKPEEPDGYAEVGETITPASYIVRYKDKYNHEILYTQKTTQGLAATIDNEGDEIYETSINDCNAIVSRHSDEETTIVIENDDYVFIIYGECPFEHIYKLAEKVSLLSKDK